MLAEIYARVNGTIAHVVNRGEFPVFTPEVGTTRVAYFNYETYETEFWYVSSNSASAFWNAGTGALEIPQGVVYLDSAWIANAQSEINTETTIQTAQSGLKDKIALAHQPNIAPHIKNLFNATLEQTESATVQPARYDNIIVAVEASNPGAFYNRFRLDLLQELGIDYDAQPHSANQQRQICFFARVWSMQLALLLAQGL